MSVVEYIKGMLPSFEASSLRDSLMNLADELDSETIPSMKALAEALPGKRDWASAEVKQLNDVIVTGYKGKVPYRDANSLELIHKVATNMQTTLPLLKNQVTKEFGARVVSSGLTFGKANLLQLAEVAEFFVNYARLYFNYVSAVELNNLSDSRRPLDGVAPDDQQYLMANRHSFVIAMRIMDTDAKQLESDLGKIPDMLIDATAEADMRVVVGSGRMDPFHMANLPFPLSFSYRIGMIWAERQLARYDQAKADARALEYRTILIKQRLEQGKGDAALERRLKDEEERLNLIKQKIEKMEKKYGLNRPS
jgi:hypothetical protein